MCYYNNVVEDITSSNVKGLDIAGLQNPDIAPLDPTIAGYFKHYFGGLVKSLKGDLPLSKARVLVDSVALIEQSTPLFSVTPFRYVPIPDAPDLDLRCTAESTVDSAATNLHELVELFGVMPFTSVLRKPRTARRLAWYGEIDRDYFLQFRGGSGAGSFSIDTGLGFMDRSDRSEGTYKELWRVGFDTVQTSSGELCTRIIRTGSGIKGRDGIKSDAFDKFRKKYNILPQRLLGLLSLYLMRELDPKFAFALSTRGAMNFSTLGRSKGDCSYDKLFTDIGFLPMEDKNWLAIPDFRIGIYGALECARIRRKEEEILELAANAAINMAPLNPLDGDLYGQRLIPVFTDDSKKTIEREIEAAYCRGKSTR